MQVHLLIQLYDEFVCQSNSQYQCNAGDGIGIISLISAFLYRKIKIYSDKHTEIYVRIRKFEKNRNSAIYLYY